MSLVLSQLACFTVMPEALQRVLCFLESLLKSQTVWTALAGMGSVITLFLIYRQIASARDVSAYQFLRNEDREFESEEMQRVRSKLARSLMLSPATCEEIDQHAEIVCGFFEDLGLLLRKGITPKFFTWTMFSDYITNYWTLLSKCVLRYREESNDETYYSEFEYLYKRMVSEEIKKRKMKQFVLTEKDSRKFLEGELHVDIRECTPSDLPQIMDIEHSAFPIDAYSKEQFDQLHKEHPDGFFVGEIFEELVGYVAGYVGNGVGQIDSMAVASKYRRLGIGRRLVEHIIAHLKTQTQGLKECSLEVRTTNEGAIRFYEKLGFRKIQTLSNYYGAGADAYLMTKVDL